MKRVSSLDNIPPFKRFVDFMVSESKWINNPMFCVGSSKDESKDSNSSARFRAHTYASNSTDSNRTRCLYCKGEHAVRVCEELERKSDEDKRKFVFDNELCFRCMRGKHQSRDCRSNFTCDTCNRNHATILHGVNFGNRLNNQNSQSVRNQQQQIGLERSMLSLQAPSFTPNAPSGSPVVSNAAQQSFTSGATCLSSYAGVRLSTMIVPVYVSHKDSSHDERLVYALLDSQSDTSFILDKTREALGIEGENTEMLLSTMIALDNKIQSQKVSGLQVRGFDSDVCISLPPVFSRDHMPADKSRIPTPEMTENWPYLQELNNKLMPISDCEIGLLIGFNCSRALIPRQVIPPQNDGPFAQKTDLGWGIIGCVDRKIPKNYSCAILSQEVQRSDQQTSSIVHSKRTSNVCGLPKAEDDVLGSGQKIDLSKDSKSFSSKEQDVKKSEPTNFEKLSSSRQSKLRLVSKWIQVEWHMVCALVCLLLFLFVVNRVSFCHLDQN